MYKILFLIVLALFFTSCSSKNSAFRYFDKSDVQAKAIQSSKKIDIIKNNEPEVVFRATYLNDIEKNKENIFIISAFFVNSQTQDIEQNGYKLWLNSQEPKSMEKIDKSDSKYKDFILKNSWANFYLVKFPLEKKVYNLNLKLSDGSSTAVLKFERW